MTRLPEPYYRDEAGIVLYHGDARDIVPMLADASIDFVFTDPPYGHNQNDGDLAHNREKALGLVKRGVADAGDARPIANDDYDSANELAQFLFREAKRLLRHGGCCCCCCCGGGGPDPQFARWSLWMDEALGFKHAVVWDKCLSGGTRLYAKTKTGVGLRTIQNLVKERTENLRLWNGIKWTKVLAISKSKSKITHRILLRSGERIETSEDHPWPIMGDLIRETRDLKPGDRLIRCELPEPEVAFNPKHMADELGWFIGLFLAEGDLRQQSSCIRLSGHANETEQRESRIRVLVESYGGTIHCTNKGNKGYITIYSPVMRAALEQHVAGRGAAKKHLSSLCWNRSNNFLLGVINGFLHGDGHWEKRGKRWTFNLTRNIALESDLRAICARLGYDIKLRLSTATCNGNSYPSMRGTIVTQTDRSHWNCKDGTEVVSVMKRGKQRFYDIAVADDPHVFSLSSGILTHNCGLGMGWHYRRNYEFVLVGEKPGGPCKWYGGTNTPNVIRLSGIKPREDDHPTPKPMELAAWFIGKHTQPGDLVLDPFCGGGSTLEAAKLGGRRAIGIDCEERWLALTVERLRQSVLPVFVDAGNATGVIDAESIDGDGAREPAGHGVGGACGGNQGQLFGDGALGD